MKTQNKIYINLFLIYPSSKQCIALIFRLHKKITPDNFMAHFDLLIIEKTSFTNLNPSHLRKMCYRKIVNEVFL